MVPHTHTRPTRCLGDQGFKNLSIESTGLHYTPPRTLNLGIGFLRRYRERLGRTSTQLGNGLLIGSVGAELVLFPFSY